MIYVNSETILKIDLFSLLIYGRVIHIWDILFLTIAYKLSVYSFPFSYYHEGKTVSTLIQQLILYSVIHSERQQADYYNHSR